MNVDLFVFFSFPLKCNPRKNVSLVFIFHPPGTPSVQEEIAGDSFKHHNSSETSDSSVSSFFILVAFC